ncbi:MAG: hypothetical protein M1485_03655 [Chloroflexi bacterium]|nr:hypothetical protein [Chloroflexota bacterium]
MRKQIILTLLLTMSLAACVIPIGGASTAPSATATISPTATATETPTPTPEATATPTETPTPEVKQFPICQIEKFRDCPITVDDLFNGNYLRWLNTLSKPFDQAKIKQVPMEVVFGNIITYNTKTAPNFRDPATAPFRRDVTAGYASYQGIDYIVMPVEYFDPKHPDKNQWVITVYSMYWPGHNQEKTNKNTLPAINAWRKNMKITAITNNDIANNDITGNAEDPLGKMTFDNNPDMAERFGKFVSGEDMGALSKPGIVLLNMIGVTTSGGHWLE